MKSTLRSRVPRIIRCSSLVLILSACSPQTPPAPAPLRLHVDAADIELSAPTPGVLCLHLSTNHEPHPPASIFLDPHAPDGAATQFHEGSWQGIHSAAGALLVDAASHQWTLRSADGRTLVPPSPLPTQSTGALQVHNAELPHLYGSGDIPANNSLLHSDCFPKLGNGHAKIPYYFSTTGYAALATSDDDDKPPAYSTAGTDVTWAFPPDSSATLYLMPARDLKEAAKSLADLTGHAPVPPRWALGYLQSRWGWKDKAYIDETAAKFAALQLPVDAFIFDFEWYTPTPDYEVKAPGLPDFRDFSFNPVLFPDPSAQIAALHRQGIHVVGIRKPRLGNAEALAEARRKEWILAPGKSNIDTRVLNFALPAVREDYAGRMKPLLAAGIDGWWNDEGELAYTLYHHWNEAELETLQAVRPGMRAWSLNRAFSPGMQRTGAAAWTGDIHATWEELQHTPATLLNWSLAGMPWVGCDIGGFSGNPAPQLLTRWMQAGVFFPVMRAHSTRKETPHFPWLYGEDAEAAMAAALRLRYQLIPTLYSLAHDSHASGLPLMRPLAMEFPADPQCADITDEWLLGDSLLAAPVLTEENKRRVYLPGNAAWYAFNSTAETASTALPGGQTLALSPSAQEIPFFIRAGTILALAPPTLEHTDDLPGGPLELWIYPGKNATFTLVEDDGATTGYLRGETRSTTFSWDQASRTLTWKRDGRYAGRDCFTTAEISLVGAPGRHAVTLGSSGSITLP